jgi:hypothetical protein
MKDSHMFGSLFNNTLRDAHDGAMKLLAQQAPEATAAAGIEDLRQKAATLAARAAHAKIVAASSRAAADAAAAQVGKYIALADKLQTSDPATAEEALKHAEELHPQADQIESQAKEDDHFASEMATMAETAAKNLLSQQAQMQAAVHDQTLARQQSDAAASRLHDRQEAAGLIHGMDTTNLALDALKANTQKAQEQVAAANMQSDALGGAAGSSKLDAAMAAMDNPAPSGSLADRIAALKAAKAS